VASATTVAWHVGNCYGSGDGKVEREAMEKREIEILKYSDQMSLLRVN